MAGPPVDPVPGTPLSWDDARLFRATAARANCPGMGRPDISDAAKELCRRMSAPQESDLAALRHLTEYLLGSPRLVYRYPW